MCKSGRKSDVIDRIGFHLGRQYYKYCMYKTVDLIKVKANCIKIKNSEAYFVPPLSIDVCVYDVHTLQHLHIFLSFSMTLIWNQNCGRSTGPPVAGATKLYYNMFAIVFIWSSSPYHC